MTTSELSAMTVLELRKVAKSKGVKLSAGISKAEIVERIAKAYAADEPAKVEPKAEPQMAQEESVLQEGTQPSVNADVKPEDNTAAQPQFRQAWRAPATQPRYSSRPAYQAPAYGQRSSSWQGRTTTTRTTGDDTPRYQQSDAPSFRQTVRPSGFTPRFGPEAQDPVAPARPNDDYHGYRAEAPRTAYGQSRGYGQDRPVQNDRGYAQDRPAQSDRGYGQDRPMQSDRGYGQDRPMQNDRGYDRGYDRGSRGYDSQPQGNYYNRDQGGYDRAGYAPRSSYGAPRQDMPMTDGSMPSMAVSEMLSASDCPEGKGVLEMHPDGYGFLRSKSFLPSAKDIYISMAQIRRFGLRTGDYVEGKTRPQRDCDKFAAMLYITTVNGMPVEETVDRPLYDELTPVYPTRRIDLDCHDGEKIDTMRLVDLMAPLGFGQRALVLCPPNTGKKELLEDFANVIHKNHSDAEVLVLLIDENPEDVTIFRDAVACQVIASTFDQPPESHLRLTDLVLERAERLVEQGKDVVLIVDSLTRLAKTYTTTAAQQGRSVPGMVNPTSLFRAKKLFGAARCMKEGGSLTVIGTMNVETESRVDDTIVEEFRGTANMVLVLDQAVAKAGVKPAFNLQQCGTKKAEALLTKEQAEGIALTRQILGSTPSATAIPQLLSMMDKVDSNATFLTRIKDWAALMQNSR